MTSNGTVVFPSPNWFHVSNLGVSNDGWLIYGGPSKSLCILEPLSLNSLDSIQENHGYHAHVVNRAHAEKIASVDISPEWPQKKFLLTGSADGCVKQWSVDKFQNGIRIKSTHVLDTHRNEKEEVAGVGYSTIDYAITVGSCGNVVKWDLRANVAKSYKCLRKFKPSCLACSHHVPLYVAVGTKQGVVFVLNLTGDGKIMYKVRGQDDEIVNVSWCPQYEVLIRKSLKESVIKSNAMQRLEKIRSETDENLDNSGIAKNLPDDSFDQSIVKEDDTFDIYKDHAADEFGHKKFEPTDIIVEVKEEKKTDNFLAECLKLKEDILKLKNDSEPSVANLVEALDKTHVDSDFEEKHDRSSTKNNKKLPVVMNDDAASAHIQKHLLATVGKHGGVRLWSKSGKLVANCFVQNNMNKNVRNKGPNSTTILWYKPDVLLIADGKSQLLECNPLLIDSKNKLEWKIVHTLHKRGLYCIASNAPRVQLPYKESVPSTSQSGDSSSEQWKIWTIAQDRNLVCYSMNERKMVSMYNTCGGFLYTVQSCPYDARRVAVSVGDGAVRILEIDTLEEDESKLAVKHVSTYWQNVQGKVLTLAWHPTRENLLAFATGESRVGLIEVGVKIERPAKTLPTAIRGAVYSMCWGEGYDLYVSGGGKVIMYRTNKLDQDPVTIAVELEGKKWDVISVMWYPTGLLCGSDSGGVAVLHPTTRELITAVFLFTKMLHSMEWHPQQTSSSSDVSPFKDLIAFSSLDKSFEIVIMEYADKGDGPKLHKWKMLYGHKNTVLQLVWNPHKDGQLLSTSHDCTIRIWNVSEGVCIAIYGGHKQSSLGAAWSAFPHLSSTVLSGGADCCLKIWKLEDYPPEAYTEISHELAPRKEKKKKARVEENREQEEFAAVATSLTVDGQVATNINKKFSAPKLFLLPTVHRQMSNLAAHMVRKLAENLLEKCETNPEYTTNVGYKTKEDKNDVIPEEVCDDVKEEDTDISDTNEASDDEQNDSDKDFSRSYLDFWKIFGSTNDVNEVLDYEMQRHIKYGRHEPWIILSMFRGEIDSIIQMAYKRDELCPFLVALSPCVSFKYWKDVIQLYLAQIGRLTAKGETQKLTEQRWYGGAIYRKVAVMLSVHDVIGAVNALIDANLFKEAYVLARVRHMDSVARDTLYTWARKCGRTGRPIMVMSCFLALGDPYKASLALANSKNEEHLSLAARLAKVAGQQTFATHIEEKKSLIVGETSEIDNEELKPLPVKMDLMKYAIQLPDDTQVDED